VVRLKEKPQKQRSASTLRQAISAPVAKLLRFFNSHRLVGILTVVVVVAAIVLVVLLANRANGEKEIGTSETQATTEIQDLTIFIPENAFPYPKSFNIKKLPMDATTQRVKEIGRMTGNVYELTPQDGRNDLALQPMVFEYLFPSEFFFGPEYNNAELVYADAKENPVFHVFGGGEIQQKNNQVVLRVNAFHGSILGLRIKNPEKPSWGLQKAIEKPDTLKPDLLVIPGMDANFLGFLPNTVTNENPQGNNIWEISFPDRTIWSYLYPLSETRSLEYMDEARQFFDSISNTSYIRFEAHRLAQALQNSSRQFDIVAHGVGGLIARYAVEMNLVSNVRKLVLISTPNAGTNIVNPSFLNLLYGKDAKVLAQIYDIDGDSLRFIKENNLSYLENVNTYYTDILPDSTFIASLEKTLRDDIEYAFIAGDYPGFNTNLANSQFAMFYPENAQGKGDGIVSVFSALYPTIDAAAPNMVTRVFPYSFFDIYIQQKTLEFVRTYLESGVETVTIPQYQDDTFREWRFEYPESTETTADPMQATATRVSPFDEPATTAVTPAPTPAISPSTATTSEDTTLLEDFSTWRQKVSGSEQLPPSTQGASTVATTTAKLSEQGTSETSRTQDVVPQEVQKSTPSAGQPASEGQPAPTSQPPLSPATAPAPIGTSPASLHVTGPLFWDANLVRNASRAQLLGGLQNPFAFVHAGEAVYLFDQNGIWRKMGEDFSRIASPVISTFRKDFSKVDVVLQNQLFELSAASFRKVRSLPFEGKVISLEIARQPELFLVQQNGLILEVGPSSYAIPGEVGKIIRAGGFLCVLTNRGVFGVENGRVLPLVQSPSAELPFVDGVYFQGHLVFLSSKGTLEIYSLSGQPLQSLSLENVTAFSLRVCGDQLVAFGPKKLNRFYFPAGNPNALRGTYYSFQQGERLVDLRCTSSQLVLLLEKEGSFWLENVGIMP